MRMRPSFVRFCSVLGVVLHVVLRVVLHVVLHEEQFLGSVMSGQINDLIGQKTSKPVLHAVLDLVDF